MRALGAPIPEPTSERVYGEADLEAAKRAKLFLDAGLPEDGVLETSRIIGISMANLADANRDLVGEVFTEPGVDERELAHALCGGRPDRCRRCSARRCCTHTGSTSARRFGRRSSPRPSWPREGCPGPTR